MNEAGTEASASTAVIVGRDGGVSPEAAPPEPFLLDHPFLVLIRHVETDAVLFLGAVTQPSG